MSNGVLAVVEDRDGCDDGVVMTVEVAAGCLVDSCVGSASAVTVVGLAGRVVSTSAIVVLAAVTVSTLEFVPDRLNVRTTLKVKASASIPMVAKATTTSLPISRRCMSYLFGLNGPLYRDHQFEGTRYTGV